MMDQLACLFANGEALSATAGLLDVWIIEPESFVYTLFDIIKNRPREIWQAL